MTIQRIFQAALALTGCILSAGRVYAQERGVPSATLSAAWAPVKVEHYIGLRGGYAMGTARFEPTRRTALKQGLMLGGLVYKFDVPAQKYVGCIEADINWSQRGYRVYESFESDNVYERKWNTIEIPILWQPYLPLSKGGTRFYLSAGPYFSYAFSSDYREYNEATGEVYGQGNHQTLLRLGRVPLQHRPLGCLQRGHQIRRKPLPFPGRPDGHHARGELQNSDD